MTQRYIPQGSAPTSMVILGTGGLARELHNLIEEINDACYGSILFLGWLDSDVQQHGALVHDHPVLGGPEWLCDHQDVEVVIGIGAPHVRRRVVQALKASGHRRFARLIHPSVVLGRRVDLGEGVIICAGVVGTTDFRIGNHVLINITATLAHDDDIGDFATIAPGANISGNVRIGIGADIGTNSTIIQGVEIGEWSVIGAGAVVTRPIEANATAVGAPAKAIKYRPVGWYEQ